MTTASTPATKPPENPAALAPTRRGRPANPEVRSGILAAALELFADRGYDATSVSEVVLRSGVTKGALYHYFASKEDLLYEIYRSHLDQQLNELDRILGANDDPITSLHAVIKSLVVTTVTHMSEVTVFSREMSKFSPERMAVMQADWRRYQDGVRDLIRLAQQDGALAAGTSPELASWMIFGFTNSLPLWYRTDGPKSPTQMADELSALVLAALQPTPSEG